MAVLKWKWLQWLLGVSGDEIPADADVRLAWTNLPQSWRVFLMLFVVAAAIYAVVWVYRKDAARLSTRQRRLLCGLRVAVVVVLALIALGPAIAHTHLKILQPVVVVLRDSSQSMATVDRLIAGGKQSRAEVVNRLFEQDDRALLSELQKRGQLRVLDFAESVRSVEVRTEGSASDQETDGRGVRSTAVLPKLNPTGPGTNLLHALTEGLSERLTAAVVLFTDGQHTDRSTGKDDLLAVAGQAKLKGVPFLIVGVGDPNRPRNVQASDVYADAQAWKDDPFELQAVVRSEGFGGEPIRVELVEQSMADGSDKAASEQVVEARDVTLPADGGQTRLSFSHTPKTAGRFGFVLRISPLVGESATDDNQSHAPAQVKVIDDKARILLVSGKPHWDYRFVRQVLEREKSIELSCWLQTLDPSRSQEGDKTIRKLPRTKEELFEYDVVLLMDPDPREFDDVWLKLLQEFVGEHAGGLLYLSGPSFTSQFVTGSRTSEIRPLLPVRFGDVAATDVSSLLESNDREWAMSVVDANLDHPLMRFHAEQQRSLDVWKVLPGILWSFPIKDAVPAASVMLSHSDPVLMQASGPRPLLVSGQYGAGRTIFVGFDGTWRWRQTGRNAEYFNRFWVQTARYLIESRSMAGKRRGTIETDRTRYEVGDRISVIARLNDAIFKPLELPEVAGQLETPGGAPVPVQLRAVANQPGRYEAAVTAQQTGRHTLRVDFNESNGIGSPHVETTFSISPPSIETERIWQDQVLLTELATASGGRYFSVDEVAQLPGLIPARQQSIVIQGKPVPLWDTSRMLLLVVALLAAEWALRKRFKLL